MADNKGNPAQQIPANRDRINNSHLSYMQIWITNAEHEENVLQYFLNE